VWRVLRPAGGLDAFTAGRMRHILDVVPDRDTPAVLIDLTRVDFVDSAGIRLLVGLARRARERGVILALAGPCPGVRRLFHSSGSDVIAAIARSLQEAMEAGRPRRSWPAEVF